MTLGLTSLCGAVIGAFVFGLIGIEKSWGFSIFGVHVIRHPVNGRAGVLSCWRATSHFEDTGVISAFPFSFQMILI